MASMEPPGGIDFKDVTQRFLLASQDMQEEEMIMSDGYALFDAMSALEIGDPRMDTGAPLPEALRRPEFDPNVALLPEEVCWILDRTFACEMAWHAGYSLSQTVHTCMYMHNLENINEIYLSHANPPISWDEHRPAVLVHTVLRAGVLGMIKCCDLAYRELVKGNVHDGEDWQGEKSEVSLYEGTPWERVVEILEEAERWLNSDEAALVKFKEELLNRLRLRTILLKLFSLSTLVPNDHRKNLLQDALVVLQIARDKSIPTPEANSPALLAYDPYVTRKLHSTIPSAAVELPSQEETWISLNGLLNGWDDMIMLGSCQNLLAWETFSSFRASRPTWSHRRIPYLRSVYQSLFSDGDTILDRLPYLWLIDQFFTEVTHISISHLHNIFGMSWSNVSIRHPFEGLQDDMAKLLVQHVWASYQNRPRQRRHLMKTSYSWHELYHRALAITSKLVLKKVGEYNVVQCIPLAILHWRLAVIRDVVLSGFELELYSHDELAFAYWFLWHTLDMHEQILRKLLLLAPQDCPAASYLCNQAELAGALCAMCTAMYLILCGASRFNVKARWATFAVRYKWTSTPNYEQVRTRDAFKPDFHAFLKHERDMNIYGRTIDNQTPTDFLQKAIEYLARFNKALGADDAFQLCGDEYARYQIGGLIATCEAWQSALPSLQLPVGKTKIEWNMEISPWFPQPRSLS